MKIIILGQPRTGKTTLAKQLANKYGLPVFHTDQLRRELGYHLKNDHRFATEVELSRQRDFYDDMLQILPTDNFILEGSAIYPCDVFYFKPDACVMLCATCRLVDEMVEQSRQYDDSDSYTRRYTDYGLRELFSIYSDFDEHWYDDYNEIVPTSDNADYENRLLVAAEIINVQLQYDNFISQFGNSFLRPILDCLILQAKDESEYSFNNGHVYKRLKTIRHEMDEMDSIVKTMN